MRFTIDNDQKKFFLQKGWLELEGMLKEKEQKDLLASIEKIIFSYPGSAFERGCFISRSLPLITQLLRRKSLGFLAYELTDERPLRLAYDHAFRDPPSLFKETLRTLLSTQGECMRTASLFKGL